GLLAQSSAVSFEQVRVRLLPGNRVTIQAQALFGPGVVVPIALQTTLGIERRRCLRFLNCQFEPTELPIEPGTVLSAESLALSKTASERLGTILDRLVDLERFNLDGVTLRINTLETRGDQLVLSGWAQVNQVPSVSVPGVAA
ncbi:MAG TPA: hypothetical protein V6D46_11225, partial [Coleofasciculaceae cyanobacterium]